MSEFRIMHSDELYHHGILGQRWGVRRFQNKDGSLTSAGKARVAKNKKSGDSDAIVLKKGTALQRISTVEEKSPRSDRAYLSYKPHDNDYYTHHISDFRRNEAKNGQMYKIGYEAKKDIRYPNHNKQFETFETLYNKKKKRLVDEISEEMAKREAFDYRADPVTHAYVKSYYKKSYSSLLGSLNTREKLHDDGYRLFMAAYSNIPISKLYQRRLKKLGYNAITDDNDVRYNTMFKDKPTDSLIVFNPNKNLRIKSADKLTTTEYKAAKKRNTQRLNAAKKRNRSTTKKSGKRGG